MRPLWKEADLLKLHAGQKNWSEQIILDPEQDATYDSAAPGTKYPTRMHPDTPTLFVVIAGQVDFNVEGQSPVTATRGAIVNIMKSTLYSYGVSGDSNALWVEVNPTNYKSVYPSADPPPAAPAGARIVKVAFSHAPAPYTDGNRLMVNTFDDTIARCMPAGPVVYDDHLFANPIIGYVNPADNKCGNASGRRAGGPAETGPFNPRSTFGHMHPGPAEWWIVQAGGISGRFENAGEFHATEGDVLYAAPMTWHAMGVEGPSGPSIRLALGGYNLINMFNTESPGPGGAASRP
jgi:mannose-6-phosphate isomerase-like protein (cupin superfamily)